MAGYRRRNASSISPHVTRKALDAVLLQQGERHLAGERGRQPVRDRVRPYRNRLTGCERLGIAVERSGSTATTCQSGAAAAMPATRPPPPARDNDRLHLRHVLQQLERHRSLSRDHE